MRTSQNTHTLPMKITPWLTLFRKIVAVGFHNLADQLNTVELIYYCLISSFHQAINEIRSIYRYDAATCRDGDLNPWRWNRQLALKRNYYSTLWKMPKESRTYLILFDPCVVTMINHTHQQMHTIYIKLQISYILEISYRILRKFAVVRETLIERNIKIITYNLPAQCKK